MVSLDEPSISIAITLVRRYATGLETQYHLRIEDAAVARAVMLTDTYMMHQRLPQKAVSVLRSICDDHDYGRTQELRRGGNVTERDVIGKVAEMTGIPQATLVGTGEGVNYVQSFRQSIVGQDHAVREVSIELGLDKSRHG